EVKLRGSGSVRSDKPGEQVGRHRGRLPRCGVLTLPSPGFTAGPGAACSFAGDDAGRVTAGGRETRSRSGWRKWWWGVVVVVVAAAAPTPPTGGAPGATT